MRFLKIFMENVSWNVVHKIGYGGKPNTVVSLLNLNFLYISFKPSFVKNGTSGEDISIFHHLGNSGTTVGILKVTPHLNFFYLF